MICKITDIGELSGENSPLLPLIYEDFYSFTLESDGVYVQTAEDGNRTLLISCRNGSVTIVKLSENWCRDELVSFITFLRSVSIIADFRWCDECDALPLMVCGTCPFDDSEVFSLDSSSSLSQYKNVFSLLGDEGDAFESFYTCLSSGIVSGRRVAVYVGTDFKSCAVCNAIFKNTAVISGVYTHSLYRAMGYGARAVKGLLGKLFLMNIKNAILWCEEKNTPFYEKTGFVRTGEIYYREETV